MKRITIGIAMSAMALGAVACGGDQNPGPLDGVESIIFIERQPRMGGMGDIFQYSSYVAGARLMQLSPPSADGTLTELLPGDLPEFQDMDIIDFDLNFAADAVVVSARLSGDQSYGLFVYDLGSGDVEQLATDPNSDYVYPTFLAGGEIMFATNANVEDGAPQFRDEYERGVTLQLGRVNRDGSGMTLFARNLSHRITSTPLFDGTVAVTQWDHLQGMNAGHLIKMNPDGTRVREAYGKEGTGLTNSYYKAVEASPGRLIAIASSRDRTFQSGTIVDIRMGEAYEQDGEIWADRDMSEDNASFRILTQSVPLGDEPSSPTVGRYYSAVPLNAAEYPDLLVTWADGPVQSDVNAAAGISPDFGIYLYDSERGIRKPIYDNPDTWEINAQPVVARAVPPVIPAAGGHQFDDEAVLMGAMNVYDSSVTTFDPGSIYAVQIIEGFSGEEGVGRDFGLTEAEGAALLGMAVVQNDGSWAALIPANVPVHQQAIDHFGMALQNEPIWISGNTGESMFCGGCHESRTSTTVVQPGITDAIAIGPVDLLSKVERFSRVSTDFNLNPESGVMGTVGIPWDSALQNIFDNKCIACHDGTPGAANPSYTIMDPETGTSQTITFDLGGQEIDYIEDGTVLTGYSASHLSLLGPDMMELEDAGLVVVGEIPIYVDAGNARGSMLLEVLNPPIAFPAEDLSQRAYSGTVHGADQGFTLTRDEYLLLIRMADFGGQFYSRENAPGTVY